MISKSALFSFSSAMAHKSRESILQKVQQIDGITLPMLIEGGFLIVTIDAEDDAGFVRIEDSIRKLLSEIGGSSESELSLCEPAT